MPTIGILCTLAVMFAVAPAAKTRRRAPDPAAVIQKELETEAAAWNRGDIDSFMATYWHSPDVQFIGSAGIATGWEPVREHYLKNYPDRAHMGHLTFSDLEVRVLCPTYAYVTGHYHLQRAQDHPQGVFTLLFRRFPDGWKIISDHTTAAGQ